MTPAAVAGAIQERGLARRMIASRQALLLVLILLWCLVIAINEPRFLSVQNFINIGDQAAILAIPAAVMTLIIICAGIDLSVGSVLALGGFITASSLVAGLPTLAAVLLGIAAGIGIGLLNGAGIAYLGIPALIMTLAMLYAVRGGVLFLAKGETIASDFPAAFRYLGTGDLLGIPVPVFIAIGVFLACGLVLRSTRFGRYVIAIGTNEDVSRRAGINVRRVKLTLYAASGAAAALAGIVLASKLNAATTNAGYGSELDVIAAVIIGGTSLFGGRGTLVGTALGVVFLALVRNGLNLLGVSPFLQIFTVGALLFVSALADVLYSRAGRQ
ncbi:MAG: ABC transporter permease [Actinomycetales bacterium]|nr:ABC transporter permease [Actinomycetales bacterium]